MKFQPVEMASAEPLVTVVMPTRNEAAHIESAVRSVLAQRDLVGGFELLVVDGGSEDGTPAIVQAMAQQDARIRLLQNPACVTPSAFNVGIRNARGSLIAIMGAHSEYSPDYLAQAVAVMTETGADNVGGSIIADGKTPLQRAIGCAFNSRFGVGGSWHDPDFEGFVDTTFGGVYRRDTFERIGLFDERLIRNQDDELNYRLRRAGGRIFQSSRLKSWYTPRDSLAALWRQYFQYGYWKVEVIRIHRSPSSVRQLVPGLFVLGEVLFGGAAIVLALLAAFTKMPALAVASHVFGWLFLTITSIYLLANFTASVIVGRKHGLMVCARLPAVFACYHCAYGWGFLLGVWAVLTATRVGRPV